MTYVLLSSSAASVSNVVFAADISYFVLSRKTIVWCFPCQNDSSVCDKDGRRTDCSETTFRSSPPLNGVCKMLGSRERATSKF